MSNIYPNFKHLSRTQRMWRFMQAWPRRAWQTHPEQVLGWGVLGSISMVMFVYKLNKYGIYGVQPYYRGKYDIVRPDHPSALNWRPPEDYPAPYLTNRDNLKATTYKRDYGWKDVA